MKEPIIADTAQLMKLALDCIDITKRYLVSFEMSFQHFKLVSKSDGDFNTKSAKFV